VAEVSAFASVVTTAVAHATGWPPFAFTARLAIAGAGEPPTRVPTGQARPRLDDGRS
jgi:hypothetical protein